MPQKGPPIHMNIGNIPGKEEVSDNIISGRFGQGIESGQRSYEVSKLLQKVVTNLFPVIVTSLE
jgi:hypothetical protein